MKTNNATIARSTLSFKVGLAYGLIGVLSVFLNFALGYFYSTQGINKTAGLKAETIARSIGESALIMAENQDTASMQKLLENAASLSGIRYLAVTNNASRIVAHSQAALVGGTIESEILTRAIASRLPQNENMNGEISFVQPLLQPAQGTEPAVVMGILWLQMDYRLEYDQALRLFLLQAVLNLVLTMGMLPIVYHIIHVLVINRLVRFAAGISQVESGNLEAKIDIPPVMGSSDELNQVADRFDRMITALRQSTAETQRQYNFALQVMNSMAQGLVLLDREGVIEYVNPAFTQLLSGVGDSYIGKDFLSLVEREDATETARALFSAKDTDQVECRLICPDLRQIDALIAISLRNKDDRTQGVILGVTDLTNHAMLERMKSDFIHRASHELRTPLTTATLMMSLLDESMNIGENKEYWEYLKESIDKQQALVDSLLLLGRIENGAFRLTPAPTYLAPMMEMVLGEMQQMLDDHGLKVVYQEDEDLPPVSGNDQALHEVFTNLIHNAVRFTIKPGTVRVHLRRVGQGVEVSVKDEGIGVPANEVPYLFTRFFRASNASHLEIQGSGLGLYFVKSVVTQLGGAVGVDSQEDVGSTFSVYLPEMYHHATPF